MVKDPSKYTKATAYGAAKYVMNIDYDDATGEVIAKGNALLLDEAKIQDEEKFDGYYAIVTSEVHMPDEEIIDKYRGLWEIEESFRITKGAIEARPVNASRKDRIEAHFLTCFIALVIIRLLQRHTGRQYSCDRIIDCLNRISCSEEQDNIYLFDYRSEITEAIGKSLGIDFSRKRQRLSEIKHIVAQSKK
jgi:transposase